VDELILLKILLIHGISTTTPKKLPNFTSMVHQLFWCEWPMAKLLNFLTPEPLDHWHVMFWDYNAKWCVWVLGESKIDFQFSVLHPHTSV
jgi:hypothetical protein